MTDGSVTPYGPLHSGGSGAELERCRPDARQIDQYAPLLGRSHQVQGRAKDLQLHVGITGGAERVAHRMIDEDTARRLYLGR